MNRSKASAPSPELSAHRRAALSRAGSKGQTASARPFLKWVGGKRQLLGALEAHLPREIRAGEPFSYLEPFLGAGAFFFHLRQAPGLQLTRATLSDLNQDLLLTYQRLRRSPRMLIRRLTALETLYLRAPTDQRRALYFAAREHFNELRGVPPARAQDTPPEEREVARALLLSSLERSPAGLHGERQRALTLAALFIFLNRTGYNGLYRVNQRGGYNVPYGRYRQPTICDAARLRAAATALSRVTLRALDFRSALRRVRPGAFVYLDPPYRPVSETANFHHYAAGGFGEREQRRLARFCRRVHEKGGWFLLSNSVSPDGFFERLYEGFHFSKVPARRAVNRDPNGRGAVEELLISNYLP